MENWRFSKPALFSSAWVPLMVRPFIFHRYFFCIHNTIHIFEERQEGDKYLLQPKCRHGLLVQNKSLKFFSMQWIDQWVFRSKEPPWLSRLIPAGSKLWVVQLPVLVVELLFPLLQLSQDRGLFESTKLFHCFVETNACWLTGSVFGSAPGAAGAALRDASLPWLMPLPPGHFCTSHPPPARSSMVSKGWSLTLCLAAGWLQGRGGWEVKGSNLSRQQNCCQELMC